MNSVPSAPQSLPASVVIPVYGNLEATRRCLDSVLASALPDDTAVLVINDASPDERVGDYCRRTASAAGWDYLENERNLGFVASANLGFDYRADTDVILLNSDTVVANDWIQRLRECAYREDDIGTVTPFSNNATICSYPGFPYSSAMPQRWDVPSLDALVNGANAGMSAEIPTAVGFCMYIKRACLERTGEFDVDNFGQGYGEECDFCMRAARAGWKHVLAADVFVFHEGGASFREVTNERKIQADITIARIHPDYNALICGFIETDPLKSLRRHIDIARIAAQPEDLGCVLAEHDDRHRMTLAANAESARIAQQIQAELTRSLQLEEDRGNKLEALLNDCRQRFAQTDAALVAAGAVVDGLKADIEELKLGLHHERVYSASLREKIELMEQSRSWRYTAWLRRR